jgi:hypothetical protein
MYNSYPPTPTGNQFVCSENKFYHLTQTLMSTTIGLKMASVFIEGHTDDFTPCQVAELSSTCQTIEALTRELRESINDCNHNQAGQYNRL